MSMMCLFVGFVLCSGCAVKRSEIVPDVATDRDSAYSTHALWLPSDGESKRHAYVSAIPIGGKEQVVELEGPAVINHIWITAKSVIPQIQALLVLRIWWDDEPEPSVEVPLGDFFGVGFGKEREFKSLMLEMFPAGGEQHSSLNSYWKMPFKKSARIEIENRSFRSVSMFFIQVDYEQVPALPDDTLYFHAQFRRENPVSLHKPYTILETRGRGNYVGTIMNYHLLGPGAWVEGGQQFYIDGEEEPSLPGTGAEDYFGHAWGFRTENNALLHGTSFGPENNKMTAYRFHIPDPVRFAKSIKATMRCHGWDVGDRQDDYSSVAIWYQGEPHAPFSDLEPPDFGLLELDEKFRKNPLDILDTVLEDLPFEGENLALKTVEFEASGHYDIDCTGDRAFDDDPGTKWCEITHPDNHWLALDLGKPALIEGFVIINPSGMGDSPGFDLVAFSIEKGESLDGPWETLIQRTVKDTESHPPDTDTSVYILPLDEPVVARFVRLYITKSCPLDPIARIQEFQVWGAFQNPGQDITTQSRCRYLPFRVFRMFRS